MIGESGSRFSVSVNHPQARLYAIASLNRLFEYKKNFTMDLENDTVAVAGIRAKSVANITKISRGDRPRS